jgi:hypothetical protein
LHPGSVAAEALDVDGGVGIGAFVLAAEDDLDKPVRLRRALRAPT